MYDYVEKDGDSSNMSSICHLNCTSYLRTLPCQQFLIQLPQIEFSDEHCFPCKKHISLHSIFTASGGLQFNHMSPCRFKLQFFLSTIYLSAFLKVKNKNGNLWMFQIFIWKHFLNVFHALLSTLCTAWICFYMCYGYSVSSSCCEPLQYLN